MNFSLQTRLLHTCKDFIEVLRMVGCRRGSNDHNFNAAHYTVALFLGDAGLCLRSHSLKRRFDFKHAERRSVMLKQCQFTRRTQNLATFLAKVNLPICSSFNKGCQKLRFAYLGQNLIHAGFAVSELFSQEVHMTEINTISQLMFLAIFTPYALGEVVELIKSYLSNTFGFSCIGLWLMVHHPISLVLCPFLELDFVLDEK